MTVITINVPDNNKNIISDISKMAKKAGYEAIVNNDDDFSAGELALLEEAFREAMLIKAGKIKPIPASELWNE
jgi:hypothetical protein